MKYLRKNIGFNSPDTKGGLTLRVVTKCLPLTKDSINRREILKEKLGYVPT